MYLQMNALIRSSIIKTNIIFVLLCLRSDNTAYTCGFRFHHKYGHIRDPLNFDNIFKLISDKEKRGSFKSAVVYQFISVLIFYGHSMRISIIIIII